MTDNEIAEGLADVYYKAMKGGALFDPFSTTPVPQKFLGEGTKIDDYYVIVTQENEHGRDILIAFEDADLVARYIPKGSGFDLLDFEWTDVDALYVNVENGHEPLVSIDEESARVSITSWLTAQKAIA